jgi:hypothetical protein
LKEVGGDKGEGVGDEGAQGGDLFGEAVKLEGGDGSEEGRGEVVGEGGSGVHEYLEGKKRHHELHEFHKWENPEFVYLFYIVMRRG